MTSIPVDISVTEVAMPVERAPKTVNDYPLDFRASDLLEFKIKNAKTNTFVKIASVEIKAGLPEDVLVGGSSTYTDSEEWRFRRFGDKTARFIRLAQLRYVIKGDTPARENAPYGNESSVNPIPMIALDDGSYWNSYSNGVGSNRFIKIPVGPRYDHLTVAIGKEYGSNVTVVCNAVRYEFLILGQSGYFNRDGVETFEYVKDRGASFRKRVDNDPGTVGTDAGGGEGGGAGGGGGAASGPVQSWGS